LTAGFSALREHRYNIGEPDMPILGRRLRIGKFLGLALVFAAWIVASGVTSVFPQTEQAPEYQIKAAFLYNFAKFVEWPPAVSPGANDPMEICVIGEDPFGNTLNQSIEGKTVSGHKLMIRRLKPAQDMKGCQVAFISSSEKNHLPSLLESLNGGGVLTVGETEGFAALGGVINFTMENDKVHFEINLDAAGRAGLKISSKLLLLARIVKEQGPGGKS
jgi:YfiR/HmsC-like